MRLDQAHAAADEFLQQFVRREQVEIEILLDDLRAPPPGNIA